MIMKKIAAVALAAAMSLSLCTAAVTADTTKAPTLSKTKLTLTVGDKKTIKVKNAPGNAKITWKSSKKAVAAVSKKGKITAKKAGKTNITAVVKVSSKTVAKPVCKVTVKAKAAETAPADTKSSVRATEYGPVVGKVLDGVESYYGIPYGKNPVGKLRWAAPVAPDTWTATRDCSEKEPIALQQQMDYTTGTVSITGTTDCLNLDVFTTSNAKDKPVFVFVHGGNNQTGSSYTELMSAYDTANRLDCVVVSINYRTNLLGFNALPAITKSGKETGNFALLDMAEALRWVRRNIDKFGGDKNNVTVSGFSAGGRNVMSMLISPEFKGLFSKAIVFSGGMTVTDLDASAKKDAEMLAPLVVEDKKAKTLEEAEKFLLQDNDEVRAYLATISDERLIKSSPDANLRMSAFPHHFGDDIVLPKEGFNGKYVNDVPIIMLTGTTELSLFSSSNYAAYGNQSAAALAFANKYGSDFYRIFNTQLSAEAMIDKYKSDIYLVQVDYGDLSGPNAIISPMVGPLGSFHGIFIPMLSKEVSFTIFADFTKPGYVDMGKEFCEYLKSFMSTGNPNGKYTSVKWQKWTKDTKQTLILDANENTGKAVIENKNVYKTNAQIIEEMEKDTSLTEKNKKKVISEVLNGRWFSDDLDKHFKNASLWD
ncbi:MAG: carboxylesterase family protein [Lachnospiraceae bacterium]|nr:carboxylesterase family protein [Lachnospiraceae bacterium]